MSTPSDPLRTALFVAAGLLCATLAPAQPMRDPAPPVAPATIAPPVAAASVAPPWRPPVLAVAGAEQPVQLQSLRIESEIAGGVAETRVEMTFFNPNRRILEGKLRFPLGNGQVVTGFALDVDGRMRDAMPVRKARAEQVFEDITRQRIDPGLLQNTQGNQYELRVYPLNPGQTRTVALRLAEPAAQRFTLPLAYAASVPRLDLTVRMPAATTAPAIIGSAPFGLAFRADANGGYVARAQVSAAELPRSPIVVRSRAATGPEITTEARGSESWFSVSMPIAQSRPLPRPLPRRVQIVWDQSGSGADRAIDRELALLDAYFRHAGTIDVSLVRVADAVQPAERHAVRGGDWSSLRASLERTVYDGASRLAAVTHDGSSSEAIWFTDGLSNFGAPWQPSFPVPVYAVSSAAAGDPQALALLAESSGGRFVDLSALTNDAARRALVERGTQVIDAVAVGARELVLESKTPSQGRVALAGVFTAPRAEITLRLRRADGTVATRTIVVDAGRNPGRLAGAQWARLTLATLAGDTRASSGRAAEIGQRFGIATRETSLLVLERLEDYVRHEIAPPAELRSAVEQLAARTRKTREESEATRIARVVQRFEARVAWWQRDFPKGELAQPKLEVAAPRGGSALGSRLEEERPVMRQKRREIDALSPPLPATSPAPAEVAKSIAQAPESRATGSKAETGIRERARNRADAPGRGDRADARDNAAGAGSDVAIALRPATSSNAAWLKRMDGADAAQQVAIYLDERRMQAGSQAVSVGFFLEAADFFLAQGDRERHAWGLRALSNLAEMDLHHRQVLRLLGYRLGQAGEHALAVRVFERVREIAPYEPQSHRDLGLALAASGDRQRAIGSLYEVVSGRWDGRFPDIELIAISELNAVVAAAERDGAPLDTAAVDRRLLRNLPLELRVVLAWDSDATDVDLHVIDPNGDEVYYGRPLSRQGGAITHDATGGYGPEEFALKVARPGRYRIVANFFGHRQQVLASSTGLMLWLSSGFGTAWQEDRRTTLRLKSESGQRVVVGEFEVKPKP